MIWRLASALLLRMRAIYWRIVYEGYRSRYQIAPSFRFNGAGIQLYGDGVIDLGDDSYIGELSTLQAYGLRRVQIGRGCMISHNVRIYSSTADADCDFVNGPIHHRSGDVLIEDGVWIGANCFIAPGVVIGKNSVVGANSVVNMSVPRNEIWGGVPARPIRRKRSLKGILTDGNGSL